LVERCRIVLMSAEGRDNEDQGEELGVDRQRVRRWRGRWASASSALSSAENEAATDKDLEKLILAVLADDARSGTPAKFTPEQVATIIALACEPAAQSGLPVSHWTPTELAREAGASVHRVLQHGPRQAVSLDILREAASSVSAGRTPSSASDVLCRRLEIVANGNPRNARPTTTSQARTQAERETPAVTQHGEQLMHHADGDKSRAR
jgi:hypothetical protein